MNQKLDENIDKNGLLLAEAFRSLTYRHFRKMADLIPVKIWLANTRGEIVFINKYWLDYSGFSEKEALQGKWADSIHPDEIGRVRSNLHEAIISHESYEEEILLRDANGHYRWHKIVSIPYQNEKGESEYWIGTMADIQETKSLQDELKNLNTQLEEKVQERTAMLYEAELLAHIGSWSWDMKTDEINWSLELFRIFEVDPEEEINFERYFSMIHPDDRDRLQKEIQEAIKNQNSYHIEHRIIRQDGSERIIDSHGKAYYRNNEPFRLSGTAQDITERRVAERMVKESEVLYRTLASNIPNGYMIMFDKEMKVLVAEGRGLPRSYQEPAVFEGKKIQDAFPKILVTKFEPYYRKALDGEINEITSQRESGEYFKATFHPLRNDEEEIIGGMCVGFDITELKKAQFELDKARELAENIINQTLDGICAYDVEMRFIVWNPAMEKITRKKEKDVIGKNLFEVFPELVNHEDGNSVKNAIVGESTHFERMLSITGIKKYYDCSLVPLVGKNNAVNGALCFLHDLTTQKVYEDKLQQSEEQLKEAQQLAKIGSFVYYVADRSFVVSDEFYRIYDYEPGSVELTNEMLFTHTEQSELPKIKEEYKNQLKNKDRRYFRNHIFRKDGERRLVEGVTKPILDAEGNIKQFNGYIQDITEKETAQEMLQLKNQELERTNNELEQFAYIASHDLKEPLRMVYTYIDLLNKRLTGQLTPETREFMFFATDGARRMQNLINDLLEYSRIGREGVRYQLTNLNTVAEVIVKIMAEKIVESRATITWNKLPTISCMPSAISQLFQNLIQNAIKFHGEDPPEVEISSYRANGAWVFKIKDNGIGIAPEYNHKIFDLFRRLHTRDKYEGTGIGLSICKKIVEVHGGRIWAESIVGQGSTFYFTIPG